MPQRLAKPVQEDDLVYHIIFQRKLQYVSINGVTPLARVEAVNEPRRMLRSGGPLLNCPIALDHLIKILWMRMGPYEV